MKSFALRISLIIVVAAGALIIGGIILVRKKSAQLQPPIQATRYPHVHLPSAEWEPKAKLHAEAYTLRNAETLASVAVQRYGHQNYYGVIKLYNHIADEAHIEVGTTLRVPEMTTILSEEGLTKLAAGEMEMILCSRAKYDRVVDQLWALIPNADGSYTVTEGVKRELLEAADDLQQATESLQIGRAGVGRPPASMIGQLKQCMGIMRAIALGEPVDPNHYDVDMVQQRYALALAYAILWARDGFK